MTNGSPVPATRSGILFIDKPAGMTSHDVVSRVRKRAGTRKVGHAGTLDPMATGLLTLGINSSTRLLTFLVGLDKEYLATMRLGETTDTEDAEGATVTVAESAAVAAITPDQIRDAIIPLTGAISQVPSSVSAIRVDGKHAYELARAGETVVLKARDVTISAFEVLDVRTVTGERDGDVVTWVDVDVRVECTSGTYIRALRRSRVGPFSLVEATTLEHLDPNTDLLAPHAVAERLFPQVPLDADQVLALSQGKRLTGLSPDGGPIAALGPDGRLVGLVQVTDGVAKPIVNFPTSEVLG